MKKIGEQTKRIDKADGTYVLLKRNIYEKNGKKYTKGWDVVYSSISGY